MGVILELARAKQSIARLEAEVARLKAQYEPELPAGYPVFEIGWFDLVTELQVLGVELMLKPEHVPDAVVKHTDEGGWAKIAPFLVYPADYYVEQVADCDDYSIWAAADSSRLFKLNGCLECWGDSQWGFHAYSLVRIAPKVYRVFEPNAGAPYAGQLMKFGENGYVPGSWK